jgi:hypothetical protein
VAQLVQALRYKFAGSIPDGVNGSIQPLTEMNYRDISRGIKAAGAKG